MRAPSRAPGCNGGGVVTARAAGRLSEESFGTAVVLDGGNEIIGAGGYDMSRGAVYLSASLVEEPAFPPTGDLADASLIEGPGGVLLGVAGGTLTDSLPVWVLEVPAPTLPLWPSTTALGSFYNIGAVATTKAPARLPFAIAFPVPAGADTAHLGMAMLVTAEEGTDSTETGPVWESIRGFYDDQNNLFSVALPTLVIEGRTVILIQDPEMTPITLDEETAAPTANTDVIKFRLDCFDSDHPVKCDPDLLQQSRSDPPEIPRVTAHELFHAFQFGGPLAGTQQNPAYADYDREPYLETNWIVEGTAITAEDSAETMKRSSHPESAVGLHPVNRSLLASDKAERKALHSWRRADGSRTYRDSPGQPGDRRRRSRRRLPGRRNPRRSRDAADTDRRGRPHQHHERRRPYHRGRRPVH